MSDCVNGWALGYVAFPDVGSTDGTKLLRAYAISWVDAGELGGQQLGYDLPQLGVPLATAKQLLYGGPVHNPHGTC